MIKYILKRFLISFLIAIIISLLVKFRITDFSGPTRNGISITSFSELIRYIVFSTYFFTIISCWLGWSKRNLVDFICPTCELTQIDLNSSQEHKCQKCGTIMTHLDGYFDNKDK